MSIKKSLRELAQALGADGEAKSIKGLVSEIAVAEGGTGEGNTVSEIIDTITITKNPLLGMTIDFDISDSVDLFGKVSSDLQEGLRVNGSHVRGVLHNVTGYTGFSDKTEYQSGHYIAIHAEVPEVNGATIKFVNRSGVKQTVDPSDGLIVLIVNKEGIKRLKFEVSHTSYPTIVKEFEGSEVIFE